MLPNKQAEIEDLFNRLFSADLHEATEDIITNWRRELASKRAEHTRQMAEIAANSYVKIVRMEEAPRWIGETLMTQDRTVETIRVKTRDVPAWCKLNGVKEPELQDVLANKREEVKGSGGKRYQAANRIFSQAVEKDRAAFRAEMLAEDDADRKAVARLTIRRKQSEYPPQPTLTTFESEK